jgi:phage terminase large subunit
LFKGSVLYEANLNLSKDVAVNQGGSSSGKTYSILQVLFTKAIESKCIITIAGQDVPNLKAGALRDALDIYNDSTDLQSLVTFYNKSERIFTFANGSIMEFKSYKNQQDAKSGKRDYLFMNEANGMPYIVWFELEIRTKKKSYIDYNPNSEFWVHEKLIGKENVQLFISDHRHNPFVPQKVRDKLEALRFKDIELFKVYGRGLTGKIEGLIFRNYNLVDKIPEGAKLIAYGMDFGFTNDPTTCLAVYQQDGELWVQEHIYSTGLTNPMIGDKLKELGIEPHIEIVADSAEPKSIMEIYNQRFNIKGAKKGKDSIKSSIDILKRYVINITRDSVNLNKELLSYKWSEDKEGKQLNVPVDFNNHLIDALRYVALNKLANSNSGVYSLE